jgi:hypothetical protein
MAGRAAYKDKGVFSVGVRYEKMHNVALPDDGVEGSLVEGALSSVEVDVVTGVGMVPCDASISECGYHQDRCSSFTGYA